MCLAVPGLNISYGGDSHSALCGIGKMKGWKILSEIEKHQDSLGLTSSEPKEF